MSQIQSVIFNSSRFTTDMARQWLKSNGLKPIKRVDRTNNSIRYRIKSPGFFKRFITKKTKKGISFVIGFT